MRRKLITNYRYLNINLLLTITTGKQTFAALNGSKNILKPMCINLDKVAVNGKSNDYDTSLVATEERLRNSKWIELK